MSQLAVLKLIEQGRISYDTPIAEYFPELRNPVIIVNDSSKDSFKPAQTPITVKHLLNFSSGLFYTMTDASLNAGYTDKEMHVASDPLSRFFSLIQVCSLSARISSTRHLLTFTLERISWYTIEVWAGNRL